MRTLTALLWNHVSRALLMVPIQARNEIWIFRHDKKPLAVLTSIFEHRRAGDWKPLQQLSPARIEKHKANAQALAHAVVGMITGFTILLHSGPPPASSTVINRILSKVELAHFDDVFDRLVVPQLTSVINAPYSETPPVGWAAFASIVRPRTEQDRLASMDQLVNTVLFEGAVAATKEPAKQELILRRALQATTQGKDVPAWGSQWTTSRVEKVLNLLEALLGDWTQEESFSTELVEVRCLPQKRYEHSLTVFSSPRTRFSPFGGTSCCLLTSLLRRRRRVRLASSPWPHLSRSLVHSPDTFATGIHKLINWISAFLTKAPTKPPASGVSAGFLVHRFVALLFQVLGPRLIKLPEAEATAHNRPWRVSRAFLARWLPR